MKSIYSLVLNDEVVAKVDELAFKNGVSRSQFINEVLAESVGVDTEKKRMQDIFDEIFSYIGDVNKLRVQRRQQSSVDFLGALNYKYNPRVTYSVELFGDGINSGELKIALRTTNPILLEITENFFNDFIEVEQKYDQDADYTVRDGKLIRKLNFEKSPDKSISLAITDYVNCLDGLFNAYVDGNDSFPRLALEKNYAKVKDKMRL